MPSSSGNRGPLADEAAWLAGRPTVEAHGNQPWLLDAHDACWAILDGSVDVFAVHVDPEEGTGARHHVAQAGPGQLLCGGAYLPDDSGRGGMALLAVPSPAVTVVALTRAQVGELLADPMERLLATLALSEWTETLSAHLPRKRRPFAGTSAPARGTFEAREGESVSARGGAACLRVVSGTALLVSDEAMPVTAANGWVPVTDDTWLEAQGDMTCEAVYLVQALRGEQGLAPIDALYRLLMEGLRERYRREDVAEVQRLRQREDVLRLAFSKTLARQASVLDAAAATAAADEDDLLAACRAIGSKMGVRFHKPPQSRHGKGYEPVSSIARASHVRYREVALDGAWWRSDHGPLLAFTREDDRPVALLPASAKSYRAVPPGTVQPVPVDEAFAATLHAGAFMFYRPLPERALRGRDIARYVLRGSRRDVAVVCGLGLLAAVIALALPLLTNLVFSYIVPSGDTSALWEVAALLFVVAVVMGVFAFTRGVVTVRVQTRVDSELQAAIWDRLLSLPPSFFRRFTAGDLATRVMNINQVSAIVFNSVVGSLVAAVFSLVNLMLDPHLQRAARLARPRPRGRRRRRVAHGRLAAAERAPQNAGPAGPAVRRGAAVRLCRRQAARHGRGAGTRRSCAGATASSR